MLQRGFLGLQHFRYPERQGFLLRRHGLLCLPCGWLSVCRKCLFPLLGVGFQVEIVPLHGRDFVARPGGDLGNPNPSVCQVGDERMPHHVVSEFAGSSWR